MSNAIPAKFETVRDGGFCIDLRPDELTVTADKSAWKARGKSASSRIFTVIIVSIATLVFLFDLLPKLVSGGTKTIVILAILIVPSVLFSYLQSTNDLHCTRESLEVIRSRRGRPLDKWIFPRTPVRQIRFAPVSYSRYGSTCALVFTVEGKKVKVLRGIECPEAQTVLRELARLGFDTVPDVGMPMMVDMWLERRNSLLGK